ncbi:cytochrome P450 72A397-like [Silene latifolia]|uniref:cytochrome P450 72A397-like n=1 Tax=Silene latifolia TaxID=37657 RepID=UPI003D78A9EF
MMEDYYCALIGISIATVIMLWTLNLLKWSWFKPKELETKLREQGFKGNPYKFVFGDSKDEASMGLEAASKPMPTFSNDYHHRVNPLYGHTLSKYGEKSFIWKGPTPIVNIGDPELIKKVLMKPNDFQKLQMPPALKRIFHGLAQLEGKEWVHHRNILNPAFRVEKIKLMVPAFVASSIEMLDKWVQICEKKGSCEVNFWPYLRELSADAISRAAFGSSYQEGRGIFELLTKQLELALPIFRLVYFPGSRFVPTKKSWLLMKIQSEIRSLLKDIIAKRQEYVRTGEVVLKDDLLGLLLESYNIGNDNQNGKISISLEEVVDECKMFYLVGQGTTSTLLVWTVLLLSKHQDWQELARQEAFATFGNSIPDFSRLNNLKTLNMILYEVLRLYPPIEETMRKVCKDMKLGDNVLPAGVQIRLPAVHIHQNQHLWGADAKEFNPGRFKDGLSNASGGNVSFFSFGWGPRNCIGSNFAMTEAKVFLVLLLRRFSLNLSPSYLHAPIGKETIQPQFGAQIIFKLIA